MIRSLDLPSIKSRVTLESLLRHYQVELQRAERTNIGDAVRSMAAMDETPFM